MEQVKVISIRDCENGLDCSIVLQRTRLKCGKGGVLFNFLHGTIKVERIASLGILRDQQLAEHWGSHRENVSSSL